MKHKNILVLLLSLAFLSLSAAGHAAEEKSGFFGIKKFGQKGSTAAKKKVKELPAQGTPKAAAGKADSELTDEEKAMIKKMSEKAPQGAGNTADMGTKEKVKLPPASLVSAVPANPPVTPKAPALPPRNPNELILRVPQPPSKIPQSPNAPSELPGTKKNP